MAEADGHNMIRRLFIILIKVYRFLISPLLGDSCRFYPSCSHYAEEAIAQYGVLKGSYLAIRRLSKCHPLHEGGVDPVPPPTSGQ